jgi:hypothetical protein
MFKMQLFLHFTEHVNKPEREYAFTGVAKSAAPETSIVMSIWRFVSCRLNTPPA